MADDKGGGGGSDWGTFEVIIVIILLVGLLSRLQGKPIVSDTDSLKSENVEKISDVYDDSSTCGLVISLPHPLEQVSDFISLAGSTNGCDWISSQTIALYAQVVDPKGLPISSYTVVPPNNFDEITGEASFTTTINISSTVNKGTGYLILVSSKNNSGRTISTRIPLTFK